MRRAYPLPFLCAGLLLAASSVTLAAEVDESALVGTYLEIWNSGEVQRLGDVVHERFQRHAGPGESVESKDQLAELIQATRNIYEPLEIRVDGQFSGPEGGGMRGTFRGVYREVSRVVEFPLMAMYEIADGKILSEWIIGDNFLALLGLGYQLTPPFYEVVVPEPSDGASVTEGAGR